jgi:hypothetical protein
VLEVVAVEQAEPGLLVTLQLVEMVATRPFKVPYKERLLEDEVVLVVPVIVPGVMENMGAEVVVVGL